MSKNTAKSTTFNLRDFLRDYGTPEQCLAYLVRLRWPDGITCKTCEAITPHYPIYGRRCYSCQNCGTQTYPTAGTIFDNSKVPLPNWFYVIFQMSKTETGMSAKQIQRELGVSYPTALRMCHKIREAMKEGHAPLTGVSETDECYIGGNPRYNIKRKRGRGTTKTPVFGIAERDGAVRAEVVPNVKRETLMPIIEEQVEEGSTIYSDEYVVYKSLEGMGYDHKCVNHGQKEYVRYEGEEVIHTNTLEGFWSYPKNAVRGVHRGVSKQRLQLYLDEYAFRMSHRFDEIPMFFTILRNAVRVTAL
jgi:transposase-like protein